MLCRYSHYYHYFCPLCENIFIASEFLNDDKQEAGNLLAPFWYKFASRPILKAPLDIEKTQTNKLAYYVDDDTKMNRVNTNFGKYSTIKN